jgi:hypothetical protein
MSVHVRGIPSKTRKPSRLSKNFATRVAAATADTEIAPEVPIEIWFQDEMRVGQKNGLVSQTQERLLTWKPISFPSHGAKRAVSLIRLIGPPMMISRCGCLPIRPGVGTDNAAAGAHHAWPER